MKTIISPLYLVLPRKTKKDKNISLNLNWYRNVHYLVNNQVKKIYNDCIYSQIKDTKIDWQYTLSFTLYYKRKSDIWNWVSVIEKYFNDCLVNNWCVEDDNIEYFIWHDCKVWWKDNDNPRMEIKINTKKTP